MDSPSNRLLLAVCLFLMGRVTGLYVTVYRTTQNFFSEGLLGLVPVMTNGMCKIGRSRVLLSRPPLGAPSGALRGGGPVVGAIAPRRGRGRALREGKNRARSRGLVVL